MTLGPKFHPDPAQDFSIILPSVNKETKTIFSSNRKHTLSTDHMTLRDKDCRHWGGSPLIPLHIQCPTRHMDFIFQLSHHTVFAHKKCILTQNIYHKNQCNYTPLLYLKSGKKKIVGQFVIRSTTE